MLPIAYYLLKVIICSGILYGYYWLLLRNKVFHKYNRFYLMTAVVLSLLLPLIKISFWQANTTGQSNVIKVLQVVSNGDEFMDTVVVSSHPNSFDFAQLYPVAYLMVSVILLIVFLHTLYVIAAMLKKYPKQTIESISFINTDAKSTPFSFLKYIFWNRNIDLETVTGKQIFKHELAHVQEGHTYDKLFINMVLIVFWCNPFFWLYRKELNLIHEFIADKKAVDDSDTAAFAAMILQATYPQHRFQLTNNFFYSPIKRRLFMLTKNENPKVNYFGRVMVLPLLVLIFAAFTFKIKSGLEPGVSKYNGKKITVVIDAGHGGSDNGAIGVDGLLEKDIDLAIAKKIKEVNNNPSVEIILTRSEDIFMDVRQKTDFANKNNADIFISLHLDATAKDSFNTKTGMCVWIAKENSPNSQSSKILADALLDAFTNNYPLLVANNPLQRQVGVRVLEGSNCPAVLIEPGCITNDKDVSYLRSEDGKVTVAKNILAAINKYANANLQNSISPIDPIDTPKNHTVYFNGSHADPDYLKTNDYKNNALVIIDSKEVGNVGMSYIEKNKIEYNSIVCYNPVEAKKKYGPKGKNGVIKITQKDLVLIHATAVTVNEHNNVISVPGDNTTIDGNLATTLIYIDGKVSTPAQLYAISPDKINSIDILKGEKLDDIIEAKGKTAVINVSLKPADLPEIKVVSVKPKPLYVIDKIVQENDFNLNKIEPSEIERIDVLKDASAVSKYGQKGINGVVEITTKKRTQLTLQPSGQLSLQIVPDPRFSIGGLKGVRINIDEFKKQTEMTATDGYSFASADVYFSGTGFTNVVMVHLNGSSLSPIKDYIDRCAAGSVITFDNVYVSDGKGNKKAIEGKAYSLIGKETNDKIFTKVEVEAGYGEGNDAWRKYLQQHLDPAIPIAEGWKAGAYTVIVQFIIHSDGSVSDVTTTNYNGTKTAQHCIDLVKKSGKWIPAFQNGKAVDAYRKQPITFLINPEDEKKLISELYSLPQFQLPWLPSNKKNSKDPC